jgi:D-glycero-D-manno-heptose 1,7-bisphosphate phosphatase
MSADPPGRSDPARPAVFLDRDGVLNRSLLRDGRPVAPRSLRDFRLLPGVGRAVASLREAGYLIVVVTNQPDIGNGLVDWPTVTAMHERLRDRLRPDALEVCPHRQDEQCSCRKPSPGMLLEAARRLTIDLQRSYMVGDRWSDIEAGRAAGCYTILINRHYKLERFSRPDSMVRSLTEAADLIRRRQLGGGARSAGTG